MTYTVIFTSAARRDVKRLPKGIQKEVIQAAESLATEPRPEGCEKLEGSSDIFRIRRGDYRILYQIADNILTITVVRARHRREVYRNLSDLL